MTQAASLTCMMEGNGDKTDNMYVCFFRIWHDSQWGKKFTYLWLNEYSTTTFTEPETAQIGLNKKKKKGLCLRNGCNENVDFNHVSPDYMYVKRVACGDKHHR